MKARTIVFAIYLLVLKGGSQNQIIKILSVSVPPQGKLSTSQHIRVATSVSIAAPSGIVANSYKVDLNQKIVFIDGCYSYDFKWVGPKYSIITADTINIDILSQSGVYTIHFRAKAYPFSGSACITSITSQFGIMDSTVFTIPVAGPVTTQLKWNEEPPLLTLFPNPANDFVEIKLLGIDVTNYHLLISDVFGRTIEEVNLESETSISILKYPPGIYFVKVISNGRLIRVQKLIKQ